MEKLCTVESCPKPLKSDGLCGMHRERRRRFGSLDLPPRPDLKTKFWSRVEKTTTCWNWTAAKNDVGYGQIRFDGKCHYVHRLSYEWANGPLAPGMLVDHMCHNPACVNPLHLRVADKKQNAENMLGATRASKSGIRGVWQIPATGQWTAQYTHAGSKRTVGRFDTASAAEAAVIAARIAHYTHNDVDRIGSRSEADLVSLRA